MCIRDRFTGNILNDNINDAPTIRLVNSIIERAILERASDIHIEPKEKELQVRMRIDGVLRKILTIPKNLQNSVISRLKIMSGMDIAERRVPKDGRFNVKNKKREFDLRVNSLPTVYGEKIVARLLDKRAGYLTPDSIGLMGDNLKKYQRAIHCTSGVILIAGPTGSGKSSTMNTMISQLNTCLLYTSLAGINKGTIQNCAVCGYSMGRDGIVYVQRNGTLYICLLYTSRCV